MSPGTALRGFWLLTACALCGLCAAGTLEDPTRPAAARPALGSPRESGPHVQAILARDGTRIAIVDGRLVHAGDRIFGVLIEEVAADGVRYSRAGHAAFARLTPQALSVRRASQMEKHAP